MSLWSVFRARRPLQRRARPFAFAVITTFAMLRAAHAADDAAATTIVVVAPRTPAEDAQLAVVLVRAVEELGVRIVTADPGPLAALADASGAAAVLAASVREGDVALTVWNAVSRAASERRIRRAGERQALDELAVAARFAVLAVLDERSERTAVVSVTAPVTLIFRPAERRRTAWLGVGYAGTASSPERGWTSGVIASLGFVAHRRLHVALAGTYLPPTTLAARVGQAQLRRVPIELAGGVRADAGPVVLALEAAVLAERRARTTTTVDDAAGFAPAPTSARWIAGGGLRGRVDVPIARHAAAFARVGFDVYPGARGRVLDDVDDARVLDDPRLLQPRAEVGLAVVLP